MAHPHDAALARLLRRQHGAFAQRQAVELGVAPSTVAMRFHRERYRELLPGVGAEHGTPDSWELRAMAALLWAGGDAALSHGSAARAHGWAVPRTASAAMHLVTRQRTRDVPDGITLHRSGSYDPATDTVMHGALRCTAPSRSLVELAGLLTAQELRAAVRAAVRRGQVDATGLVVAISSIGRARGVADLRTIVGELSPLHRDCRSWLEAAFVDLTAGTGLEPTAMNHPVRVGVGRRRVLDAVYLPEHLPVELDGAWAHSTALDLADDHDREVEVRAAGPWRPFLRFTHDDVTRRGDVVLDRLEVALREAGSARRRRP